MNDFAYMKKREEEMRDTNGEAGAALVSPQVNHRGVRSQTLDSGVPFLSFAKGGRVGGRVAGKTIACFTVATIGKQALLDFSREQNFLCDTQLTIFSASCVSNW